MSARRATALALAAPALALATALAASGCGNDERPLPAACATGARPVTQALIRAPGPVRLAGDTKLSSCVERARSEADIQTIGIVFTRVADELAAGLRTSDDAALQLGYLVGAVRKGARHTNGIHEELVRRVEQTTGLEGAPAARRTAFDRGLAAGERSG
jgi:hypothetical protein